MKTRALVVGLLLAVLATQAHASPAEDYAAVLAAYNDSKWLQALDLAEQFVKDHPDFRHTHAAWYMGANSGRKAGQVDRSEAMYRALLEKFPESRHLANARNELVTLLWDARRLDACIKQCEANLKAGPESKSVESWRWTIADALFRQWKFKEAEDATKAFLKDFPESARRGSAAENLAMINPPIKVGADGIVEGYKGKYEGDARLARALKAVPGHVGEAWKTLAQTLGVELAGKGRAIFEFRDKGFVREAERAITETIAIDYKPVTRIVFYTEHVVVSEPDFKSRLTHELKHAAFREIMGQGYLDLPKWVREGLAVYGARQTEDRICAVMSNEVVGGKDPRRVLDGIDDADHNVTDYVEDALAFEWLESRKKGAVHEYCKRLLAGEKHDKLFAELAGIEYAAALKAAGEWIRAEIDKRLGLAASELLSLQREHDTALGHKREANWAETTGIAKYEAWLKDFPDHLLAPNAKYRLARVLIAAGRHEDGRAHLRVVAADELRCTLTDDAQQWIARSFALEGKADEAKAAFGVLLRDYSWSAHAAAAQGNYKPAGPVKE